MVLSAMKDDYHLPDDSSNIMNDEAYLDVDPDSDPTVNVDGFELINSENEIDAIELFRYAATQQCSDILLNPGSPPWLRIHGVLHPIEGMRKMTSQDTDDIRQQTMSDSDQGQFVQRVYDHSYAYELPGVGRFRIIVTRSLSALNVVARKLVETPPSFDDLGTNPAIRDLANFSSGLILVSGITGSGKSTLMAAMINEINATKGVNIVSIEDPVEILHKSIKANIIQRNIGTDVLTFSDGVRDAMRQDPDIILIGEIRDMETAQAALKAAETGHLVISTLHAKTTVTSVSRMLDLFAGEELKSVRNRFSDVLRGIVSQKLVRSTLEDGLRVPVNEILLNTNQLRLALENGGTPTELRAILEKGKEFGMQTFEQHFTDLVALGLVTEKIALAQAGDPDQMKIMLANLAEEKKLAEVSLPAKTKMSFPPTKIAPAIPFSVRVKEEEQASGVVITPSGAAFALPKAPIRPDIYLPPK